MNRKRSETRLTRRRDGTTVVTYRPKHVEKEFEAMRLSTTLDGKTDVLLLKEGRDEHWMRHGSKETTSFRSVFTFPKLDKEESSTKRKKKREKMKKKLLEIANKKLIEERGIDFKRKRSFSPIPPMDRKVAKAIANIEELNRRIKARFGVRRPSDDEIRTFFRQYSRSESPSFEVSWDEDELASEESKKKKKKKDKKAEKVEKNKRREKEKPVKSEEPKEEPTEEEESEGSSSSYEGMVFYEPAKLPKPEKPVEKKEEKPEKKKSEKLEKPEKKKKKSKSASGSGSDEVLAAQAFDYRGRPITHPLAITPFPGACSAETRENARKILAETGKKIKEKEDAEAAAAAAAAASKPTSEVSSAVSSSFTTPASSSSSACSTDSTTTTDPSATSSFSTTSTTSSSSTSDYHNPIVFKDSLNVSRRPPTRVSSDTRFPGARSPATRDRVRTSLKEFAIAHFDEARKRAKAKSESSKSSQSSKSSKSSSSSFRLTGDKSSDSCASLRTIYSKSFIMSGCDKCTMCTDCIIDCLEKHTDRRMLTEQESKSFHEQVTQLREQFGKRLVNTRRTASSPPKDQQNSRVSNQKPE